LSAAGAEVGVAGSYELIATEILTASQTSVVFSSLGDYASTYKHLQIRATARTNRGSLTDGISVRLNADTANNYARHGLYGDGSSVASYGLANQSFMPGIDTSANSSAANIFGAGVIDLLDPYSTTKNKTVRALAGNPSTGFSVSLGSGHWRNTASVTSITLFPQLGTNIVAGSRFSLYGIKG
jgi:hypothetical protein